MTILQGMRQYFSFRSSDDSDNYIQRALDFLQNSSSVLGLSSTQPKEFVPDPMVSQTSSGTNVVHLSQRYLGIPIFQAATSVKFAPDKQNVRIAGNSITIPKSLSVEPKISVQEAVLKVAEYLSEPNSGDEKTVDQFGQPINVSKVDIKNFKPFIITNIKSEPKMDTVLDNGPFGDKIKANLTWFDMGDNDIRLAWEVVITMPNFTGKYRTLVDSKTGKILYCHQLLNYLQTQGRVYTLNGGGDRQLLTFPRSLKDYDWPALNLPNGFPDPWVTKDATDGNCVEVIPYKGHWVNEGTPSEQFFDDGPAGEPVKGTIQNDICTF